MTVLVKSITVLLVSFVVYIQANAQANVIDLGTDTVYYDSNFEYLAAFEMEAYMESFIFYRAAMEAYQRNDLFSAKASVSKAIKLNKRELKFQLLKAWILSKEKAYKKAIKYTNKILTLYPQSQEALYCKAVNQYSMKDYQGAISSYSELLRINEADARAYFGRAEVKVELEDFNGAIADYDAALIHNPSLVLAYEGRGMAHFKIFDFHRTVRDLNQFLVAKPDSGKGYYFRGLAYLRLNEFSDACKSFEEAKRFKYRDADEYFGKYCDY